MVTNGEPTHRRAVLADVPALVGIVTRCDLAAAERARAGWTPPSSAEEAARLTDRLSEPSVWALMALLGEVPAGFATWRPGDDPDSGHVSNLFVDPPHWGTGIGRGLLACAEDAMRAAGYGLGVLLTEVTNVRARTFYERAGWTDTGARRMHETHGEMVVYERRLHGA